VTFGGFLDHRGARTVPFFSGLRAWSFTPSDFLAGSGLLAIQGAGEAGVGGDARKIMPSMSSTVLGAWEETENALISYHANQES